jgi:hypothetical protein
MRRRDAARAAARNVQAIEWVKTHTLKDLEALANEMSGLGQDVGDIVELLDDLKEIDQSLHHVEEPVPEMCECAEIAG